jgi:hypothetical protein
MVQSVIIINNSNFNKQNNNGNSFIYKFPKQITFNPMDKIGIQSASLFNTFYNISNKLNNNRMSIVFPCNNPSGGSTAVFQGNIGNSVQFTGEIENPPAFEISGSTITTSTRFTGFVGGAKITFTNAFISNTTLTLVSPNSAPAGISTGMFINGTSTRITSIYSTVNGANTFTTYTLSSTMSSIGSSTSPVNTIFACGTGKNVYYTATIAASNGVSASVSIGSTNPVTTLFIQGTGLSSQAIKQNVITTAVATYTLLDSASNIYVPSTQISAGIATSIFTGTSTGTIFPGMTFFYGSISYTIIQSSVQGTLYTLTLDKLVGIFPITTISNVGIPNNSFSILTVSGEPLGSGIYLPNGTVMTLSGIGVNPNVTILGAFSSTGISVGVAGIYKISYNPNTLPGTMTVNDNVTNNTRLSVNSVVGTITNGMIFKVGGRTITIGSQVSGTTGSVGIYNISTPTTTIPSIYPQQLTASASFSSDITIPFIIPDGYYTADILNKYIQQIMIECKLYITDGVNAQTSLFYIEITQNVAFYSLQVNIHPLPSTLSSSQALPIGANWTLINDGTKYNPQLIINPALQEWFGFSSTVSDIYTSYDINNFLYIPKAVTTLNGVDLYYLSNVCPKINTINSIVLCCNLINSEYSIPSNVFFNIPLNASFGNMIVINPFDPSLCNVRGGMEQNIEISFFDTDFNPIAIRDTDITLTLVIQKSDIY